MQFFIDMGTQPMTKEPGISFLPASFTFTSWADLEPYFNDLLRRPLDSTQALQRWIIDKSQLDAVLSEGFAWRYIHVTRDSNDETAAEAYSTFVQEISPQVASLENDLNLRLVSNPYYDGLSNDTFHIFKRKINNSVDLFSPDNVNLQKEIQLQSKEFGRILSQMTIGMDGQQLTLQKASALLEETDRGIRQKVYHKINQRLLQDTEELEDLFDSLLKKRHNIAINAGFDNYRDYAFSSLERFDYTPDDCYAFHDSIATEILPILNSIYLERKNSLGLSHLRPYDLNIDTKGRDVLRPFKTTDDLVQQTIQCLDNIDPLFVQVIEEMQKLGHLDLDSRKGKRPGGYNMPLHVTGVPYIFMNANNSLSDLRTFLHESGHAVHAYLTKDLPLATSRQFPSEISELAAMTMELLGMNYWDQIFEGEDLQRAELFQMEMVIKVLPWIATIDKFQHWLYTNPGHSRAERRQEWLKILKEFTPEVLDYSGLEDYLANLWLKQLHLFEVPFYYIEYGFAQLGAIAIWQNYHENPEQTVEQYTQALKLGYTRSVTDIYEAAGIRFDFRKSYIARLGKFIEQKIQNLVH